MKLKLSPNTIRNTILILLASLSYTMYAQSVSPYDRLYWKRYTTFSYRPYNLQLPVAYLKQSDYVLERGITQYTTQTQKFKDNGKAKKVRQYRAFGFDDKGRCISLSGGKIGKPIEWSHVYKYNDKDYMYILESKNKKGEIAEVQQHNYYKDQPGLYDFVKINGKGDTLEYTIREPIDSITNTSYDRYYKKGKLKYTWYSEYYPDGQQKRTTATDGKGKVQYVWNFECDANGIEIAKHKDTSKLCVSREYDKDSTLTKVSLAVDEKGELYKTVEKRNKFKKQLATIRTNETKGYKESEYTNTYASDGQTILSHDYKSYYKGKLWYSTQTAYDTNGNRVEKSVKNYKKGVLYKSTKGTYQFDSENRPIVYKSTLENGKPSSITKFVYTK